MRWAMSTIKDWPSPSNRSSRFRILWKYACTLQTWQFQAQIPPQFLHTPMHRRRWNWSKFSPHVIFSNTLSDKPLLESRGPWQWSCSQ